MYVRKERDRQTDKDIRRECREREIREGREREEDERRSNIERVKDRPSE
jgi:hypothetical protein